MRTTMKSIVAGIVCLLLLGVSQAWAARAMDIKITTIQLKQQQMGEGIDRLSKYITANLGNKVRVRTYPAAQLYTGQEEVQAIIKGEIQMAYVIASPLDNIVPAMQLVKMPFICPNPEAVYKLLDGNVGKKLYGRLENKGIHVLAAVTSGTAAVSNSRRPLKNVEDFKGIKMRAYGTLGAAILKSLGAISVVTAGEETYSALQQGVIEGTITPADVFFLRKYYDVQKYVTNPGPTMTATLVYLIANADWWKKLPADVRAGVQASVDKLQKEQRAEIEQHEKTIFQQIAAKGTQVTTLTAADQANWKKALQAVYTEMTPEIGADLLKEAQQEIEKMGKTK